MSLKDIDIKIAYDSNNDDIVEQFYKPVLNEAVEYDRLAGFFSSSSLVITAKGLIKIALSGGIIKLIVSPRLSAKDVKILNDSIKNPEKYIGEVFSDILDSMENELEINYRDLLAHLVANNKLKIKVAILKGEQGFLTDEEVNESGMFHEKIGIIRDKDDNIVTFSGSVNESYTAWKTNIEEFKTFKSWIEGQFDYCNEDIKKFNNFWNSSEEKKLIIMDLPSATREKMISISKRETLGNVLKSIERDRKKANKISLFEYQEKAVEAWEKSNKIKMFAMATGTGKTRTALACVQKQLDTKEKTLIIISTPQSILSTQWKSSAEDLNIEVNKSIIYDSTNWHAARDLEDAIIKLNLAMIDSCIVYTTHASSCKKKFRSIVDTVNHLSVRVLFVGDEAHSLGSPEHKSALNVDYEYRIGLSATPNRWFDELGTRALINYFGKEEFEFSIKDALTTINPLTGCTFLVPYNYHPIYVNLNDEENEKFLQLTNKIKRISSIEEKTEQEEKTLQILLEKRAKIVKGASNKTDVLKELMKELIPIKDALLFTSDTNFNEVMNILDNLKIRVAAITKDTGVVSSINFGGVSERQMIINMFKKHEIDMIAAIKCMDEGIDIPTAETAILMSSNTNPREYIQRIGRVIRYSKNKSKANIYDFVVQSLDKEVNDIVFKRELTRIREIASTSINVADIIDRIFEEGEK